MRLTIVGSGTAAPEAERVASCYFVEHGDARILLDCGPGAVHHLARFGLPWQTLDHVLLTHFHNDHTGDLPMLMFGLKWGAINGRTSPLSVTGPVGLHDRMRAMAAAFGEHVLDPGFPLRVREIGPGERMSAGGVDVAAASTPHTDESLCFRLEADGATVGYTGDTGYSGDVARFLAGVDLLVSECALPDDDAIDAHLTPSRLAAMAAIAVPAHLLLTHVYPTLRDPLDALREAGYHGAASRATDGRRIDVRAGSAADASPESP